MGYNKILWASRGQESSSHFLKILVVASIVRIIFLIDITNKMRISYEEKLLFYKYIFAKFAAVQHWFEENVLTFSYSMRDENVSPLQLMFFSGANHIRGKRRGFCCRFFIDTIYLNQQLWTCTTAQFLITRIFLMCNVRWILVKSVSWYLSMIQYLNVNHWPLIIHLISAMHFDYRQLFLVSKIEISNMFETFLSLYF